MTIRAADMVITISAVMPFDDPNKDSRIDDLHNEILDLVRTRLSKLDTRYRLTWYCAERGEQSKALGALTDHVLTQEQR